MNLDLLETFDWPVHLSGYQVVTARVEPSRRRAMGESLDWAEDAEDWSRVVVPRDPTSATKMIRPLGRKNSGLFREFAATALSEAGVLAFANEYGLLGLRSLPSASAPLPEDSLAVWLRHVRAMSFWAGGRFEPQDRQRVCDKLNAELTRRVTWRLWVDGETFRIGPRPVSLIGALWLQAGFSLARESEFRTCICGKPFEVAKGGTTGKRSDAQFCSDACKSRNFRKVRRVYQLKDGQTPIAAIAASVGQDRSWVTAVLRERRHGVANRRTK